MSVAPAVAYSDKVRAASLGLRGFFGARQHTFHSVDTQRKGNGRLHDRKASSHSGLNLPGAVALGRYSAGACRMRLLRELPKSPFAAGGKTCKVPDFIRTALRQGIGVCIAVCTGYIIFEPLTGAAICGALSNRRQRVGKSSRLLPSRPSLQHKRYVLQVFLRSSTMYSRSC